MIVTKDPITIGGKNLIILLIKNEHAKTNTLDNKIAPYKTVIPPVLPIEIIGPNVITAHPNTTGNLIPINRPIPKDCKKVAIPQVNKSAEIKKAKSKLDNCKALAKIIGTITAAEYITNTC